MARKPKAREAFTRYDTADYLKSEADVMAYLEAALEEADDDPTFLAVALGNVARARGMMDIARKTGISREGLYKALSPDGNPRLGTILKVMKALGLRLAPKRVDDSARPQRRTATG